MHSRSQGFSWSAPFHGVQHFGTGRMADRWATVMDYGSFAYVVTWTPGEGLRSPSYTMPDAAAARAAGEAWVASAVAPQELAR